MPYMDAKEMEEFAYVASHDLQEPLRKITSFSERLAEKLPPNLDPEIQLYISRILVATKNMRYLLDSLLEFSRTSRTAEPFVKTDLNDILSQVISDLELNIEESGTSVNVHSLPAIECIPVQMKQLFTNLLSNAIKFKLSDTLPLIDISTKTLTEKEKINYGLKSKNEFVEIVVKDNGIGFAEEYKLKIFQIFQRLHGRSEYPGTGIGLAICKKIVDYHHGLIFAKSEEGKGAEFFIVLPVSQTLS